MAGRRRQHEGILADRRGVERDHARIAGENRCVQPRVLNLFHQRLCLVFAPDDGEVGEGVVQGGRHLGQQVRAHGGDHADPECAGQGIALLASRLVQVTRRHQHLARSRQHRLTRRRHAHASRVAFEDLDAQRAFQARDLGAQRRLRHAAGFRGLAKPAQVGDRHQILQLPEGIRGGVPESHSHRLSL